MTHTTVSVADSSTLVLAGVTKRQWLLIQNDSDRDIYLKFGTAALLNEGILLTSNGGSFLWDKATDPGIIYAIHAGTGETKGLLVSYF